MILYINTVKDKASNIELKLIDHGQEILRKEFDAVMQQSEKLLVNIDLLLQKNKIDIKKIQKIVIENCGGSFSALRIGVSTANALGYALDIPVEGAESKQASRKPKIGFDVVEPIYSRDADITISKKKLLEN